MSVLSRVLAPRSSHGLAGVVTSLLSNMDAAPLPELAQSVANQPAVRRPAGPAPHGFLTGPTGLGTSAARLPSLAARNEPAAGNDARPELFCPGAVRDDPALGEEVNGRLIEWAERVGIYPGQLYRLVKANFGRLMVDPVAGYEPPAFEFADPRVRRVFSLAGTASVILNDVYSMAKESDTDFDLPKIIAAEERCSPQEALNRTVCIHNELMHTFVAEAAGLFHLGSPALRRFLADIWAWLGGNREWHSTTARYHGN